MSPLADREFADNVPEHKKDSPGGDQIGGVSGFGCMAVFVLFLVFLFWRGRNKPLEDPITPAERAARGVALEREQLLRGDIPDSYSRRLTEIKRQIDENTSAIELLQKEKDTGSSSKDVDVMLSIRLSTQVELAVKKSELMLEMKEAIARDSALTKKRNSPVTPRVRQGLPLR